MRIAIFCPTVSGAGGMEAATRNLLAGFRALGDEVHLFLFGGSFNADWLRDIEHTQFGSFNQARATRLVQYAFGAVRALAGWKPDAIICADVTSMKMAQFGRKLSGRRKTIVASWIHFPLKEIRMKEKLGSADLHLAVTRQTGEDLQAYLPAQRERVYTIYNAVDEAALIPRPESPVFLYAGRLNFDGHKRVNDILQAAALLRGTWHLKIIGAPPAHCEDEEVRLHALADDLGIASRITWMGWQQDAWSAAGEVTALLSSSSREAFGMVLVEACSRGIACVSSACAGPLEILRDRENGWLYPIGDVKRLAAILQRILDDPLALPPQQQIRESVRQFSTEAVAERARYGILETIAAHNAAH